MPPLPLPPPVDCFFLQPLPFYAAAMPHRHCHLQLIVFSCSHFHFMLPPLSLVCCLQLIFFSIFEERKNLGLTNAYASYVPHVNEAGLIKWLMDGVYKYKLGTAHPFLYRDL